MQSELLQNNADIKAGLHLVGAGGLSRKHSPGENLNQCQALPPNSFQVVCVSFCTVLSDVFGRQNVAVSITGLDKSKWIDAPSAVCPFVISPQGSRACL